MTGILQGLRSDLLPFIEIQHAATVTGVRRGSGIIIAREPHHYGSYKHIPRIKRLLCEFKLELNCDAFVFLLTHHSACRQKFSACRLTQSTYCLNVLLCGEADPSWLAFTFIPEAWLFSEADGAVWLDGACSDGLTYVFSRDPVTSLLSSNHCQFYIYLTWNVTTHMLWFVFWTHLNTNSKHI